MNNVIILEDKKGFRKHIVVNKFPPDYRIVEIKPLRVRTSEMIANDPNFVTANEVNNQIIFYPKGEPKEEYGDYFWLYKEMS